MKSIPAFQEDHQSTMLEFLETHINLTHVTRRFDTIGLYAEK